MAETAAILSPQKQVILPVKEAGCPMADMITASQLKELKEKHPEAVVVCYVNSTAEVKAESDYCCTSANAEAVVSSIDPEKEIIFVPDRNLGQHTADRTGRNLILWPGFCSAHVRVMESDINRLKEEHPEAHVIVHPECTKPVRAIADGIFSTGGMLKYPKNSIASEFIVGTELGILHRLRKENPDKQFYPAAEAAVCFNMKRIELQNILWALESMQYKVSVPEDISAKASLCIERMISITA